MGRGKTSVLSARKNANRLSERKGVDGNFGGREKRRWTVRRKRGARSRTFPQEPLSIDQKKINSAPKKH